MTFCCFAPLSYLTISFGILFPAAAVQPPLQAADVVRVVDETAFHVFGLDELDIDYAETIDFYKIRSVAPYAVIDQNGKAHVGFDRVGRAAKFRLAIQIPKDQARVSGSIFLPIGTEDPVRLKEFRFDVPLNPPVEANEYYKVVEKYYRFLLNNGFTGRFWFRYRMEQAIRMQGKTPPAGNPNQFRQSRDPGATFDLFSGSTAIAENLQLDRRLLLRQGEPQWMDVDSIPGITINEFDWKKHLNDEPVRLDTLADCIPFDQHAVFLPSVGALREVQSGSQSLIFPALVDLDPESVDRRVIDRYFAQLYVDQEVFDWIQKQDATGALALTGSDPFSDSGTDIGVIIQFKDETSAAEFREYYLARLKDARPIPETPKSGFKRNRIRTVSAYCFQQADRVVLANSPAQSKRIRSCLAKKVPSVKDLDEYHFFRQRYVLDGSESAFAFLSDAAIRRWCSARWRIGRSRQLQALTLLHELQAAHAGQCLKLKPGDAVPLELGKPEREILGRTYATHQGIHSETYGSISFLTPIRELTIDRVTESEKRAYEQWRDGYQRNWTGAFDPIGIQAKISQDSVNVDVSVIPLIMISSYRWSAQGKPMPADAGDSHAESLVHLIASIGQDPNWGAFAKGLEQLEFYIDDAPDFWKDFDSKRQADKYLQENLQNLPVGVVAKFDTPKSMQEFLDRIRVFVPYKTEDAKHRDRKYLKLTIPKDDFLIGQRLNLFVWKNESSVMFAFDENLTRRAIDRHVDKIPSHRKWLGQHMALQIKPRFFRALEALTGQYYQQEFRSRSWKNLPLLNDLRREFGDVNAKSILWRFWSVLLVCPGGGIYRFDKASNSYYSTAYGSPVKPRIPMGTPFPFRGIKAIDAGVTFETDGLRGRITIRR